MGPQVCGPFLNNLWLLKTENLVLKMQEKKKKKNLFGLRLHFVLFGVH
jgi:hypothetical protein